MGDLFLLKKTNVKSMMVAPPPFGPGAPTDIAEKTAYMEVWGSRFSAPGPDYCVFRLFDEHGNKLWEGRVDGY